MLLLQACRRFIRFIFIFSQYLTILTVQVACGSQEPAETGARSRPEPYFAADLQPLVTAYEADANAAQAPVEPELKRQLVQVIWVDDLGRQGSQIVLGRCERFNEDDSDPEMRFRLVKLRRPDAKGYVGPLKLDALTLKTVVYHELGHCLHDFHGHLPESARQIMSATLPKERFQSFQQLLQQHFSLLKQGHSH